MKSRVRVAIAHYGSGNTRSVAAALGRIGAEVSLVERPTLIPAETKALVLPGVGAFKDCMSKLSLTGWSDFFKSYKDDLDKFPVTILGICVGFQILAQRGTEGGGSLGLGLIQGVIGKIEGVTPAQHVGWDSTRFTRPFLGFDEGDNVDFYYDHGFAYPTSTPGCAARSGQGDGSCVAAQAGRIWGVQFHPERSGDAGLSLLSGFLRQASD